MWRSRCTLIAFLLAASMSASASTFHVCTGNDNALAGLTNIRLTTSGHDVNLNSWPEWWQNDMVLQWDGSWQESIPMQTTVAVATPNVQRAREIFLAHGFTEVDESGDAGALVGGDIHQLTFPPARDVRSSGTGYRVMPGVDADSWIQVQVWSMSRPDFAEWQELSGIAGKWRLDDAVAKSIPPIYTVHVESDSLAALVAGLEAHSFNAI